MGSERGSLILQFLAESCLISSIAAGFALILAYILLPLLGFLASLRIEQADWLNPVWLLGVMAGALVIGVLAGLYPAFHLASFQPLEVLRGEMVRGRRASVFRKSLLVFQFFISITLIICTLTLLKQLHFLRAMEPGFSQKQIIHTYLNPILYASKDVLKQKLLAIPGVSGVSFSCRVPGQEWWVWGIGDQDVGTFHVNSIDPDYLDLMNLKLLQGRNFSRDYPSDRWQEAGRHSYIMNETAARRLGLTQPVPVIGGTSRYRNDTLIGIVKDFHYYSPHTCIEPLILYWSPGVQRSISIKIETRNVPITVEQISHVFTGLAPAFPFEFSFLDESYGEQFRRDERLSGVFTTFSSLAVGIAAMGLFGLTSFQVLQRRKEVGVRKALGASTRRVYGMFVGEFLKWVILANVIAWPLAYLFMSRWLAGFAYHTSMDAGIFISAGSLALLIALLTVSVQSIRAARANPVESLRYE
jgi:putative ABC transport system permease protein